MNPDDLKSLWLDFWGWAYKKALVALTQPAGGIGIVEELGSGYSVEGERMANIERLRSLGMEAVNNPSFAPRDGKTYCNFGARFIAEGMGYFGLPANALANDLIAFISTAPGWVEDSIERAAAAAAKGGLAFVCLEDHPHGHVVALAPEPPELSSTWGQRVPMAYNVGRKNGLIRLSSVYRLDDLPRLRSFIWEASVA